MSNFIDKFEFMHQKDGYTCGYVSACMAINAFDVKLDRRFLIKLLRTRWNKGTFQSDMIYALKVYGPIIARTKFRVIEKSLINSDNYTDNKILDTFEYYFNRGYIAIACVDKGEHYIVVRGIRGSRVHVADPSPTSGAKYHTKKKFLKRIEKGSVIFLKKA